MNYTWYYHETIYYRAKQVFEEEEKALMCAAWCMAEKGNSFQEIADQLDVYDTGAIALYNEADYLMLYNREFREKTNELLNG